MSARSTTGGNTSGTATRAELINKLSKGQRMAAEHPQLGVLRDVDLAKKLGTSRTTVELARRKMGILSARDSDLERKRKLILAQEDLGKVRDKAMADRLGLGLNMVRTTRVNAGIGSDFEMPVGKAKVQAARTKDTAELLRRWKG